ISAQHLDRHEAAETTDSGSARAVVNAGRSDAGDVRAMTERIRRALTLDEVFGQDDFARQVWMVGINARIHDGDDYGSISQGCIPGLPRPDELRRPLGDVAVFGRWVGCGVIGIIRDEHRLHDIVEGHSLDVGLLLEARHQAAQGLSPRVDEVQRIVVSRLYKIDRLLRARQSELEPGVDRSDGISMSGCGYDG